MATNRSFANMLNQKPVSKAVMKEEEGRPKEVAWHKMAKAMKEKK